MKIITIIGASGELGFKLVQKLSKNYSIRCIVRNPEKKDFSKIENTEVFKIIDITHTHLLAAAFESSSVIINAGYIWFAPHINEALLNVKLKPEQIIFTGSTGIFTKLPSNGAQLKRDAEKFIKDNYTINWTILRPTMIYGHSNDRNISRVIKILNKTPIFPIIGKGENLIQPVFIEDLIRGFDIAVLNSELYNTAFNIGARNAITNKLLFKTIGGKLNKKIHFISVSPLIITSALRVLSFIGIKPISQEQVLRFQEDKSISIVDFIENFDFTPISFEDGVSKQISVMKNNHDI